MKQDMNFGPNLDLYVTSTQYKFHIQKPYRKKNCSENSKKTYFEEASP
jgi:hypothetical protein